MAAAAKSNVVAPHAAAELALGWTAGGGRPYVNLH